VREQVRAATRQYAKRQRTWFRKEPAIVWFDATEGPDALAVKIARLWRVSA
jgi:tRNA dimethylallyltransferase